MKLGNLIAVPRSGKSVFITQPSFLVNPPPPPSDSFVVLPPAAELPAFGVGQPEYSVGLPKLPIEIQRPEYSVGHTEFPFEIQRPEYSIGRPDAPPLLRAESWKPSDQTIQAELTELAPQELTAAQPESMNTPEAPDNVAQEEDNIQTGLKKLAPWAMAAFWLLK